MATIQNIEEQVDKVIDEVNRNYSKGLTFIIGDLTSVRVVENMSDFSFFLSRCRTKFTNTRTATYITGSGANQKFRKN